MSHKTATRTALAYQDLACLSNDVIDIELLVVASLDCIIGKKKNSTSFCTKWWHLQSIYLKYFATLAKVFFPLV